MPQIELKTPIEPIDALAPAEQAPAYRRPEALEVAPTVELIQGAQWRGPRDHPNSWPIYSL